MEYTIRYAQARYVTLVGVIVNILLSIIKIFFGIAGRSHGLVADGVHSLSDLLSDALVLFASRIGSQAADSDHPYGHARIETAATVLVAMLLMMAGIGIIYDALSHIYLHIELQGPTTFTLWVAIFSILANELVYRFTLRVANKIQSQLLLAHAWHRRSDAAASIVVLIGIVASFIGASFLDKIAAVIVGVMIIKMGWSLGLSGARELVDTGLDEAVLTKIRTVIMNVHGVKAIHQLRTRTMGSAVLVDVHVLVDSYLSVSEGHHIGQHVHLALMREIPTITDVTVHIDPEDDEVSPPSSHLPSRHILLPTLISCWQGLPGADNLKVITTHYLGGKIYVHVGLPLELAPDRAAVEKIVAQYRDAVAKMPEIAEVRLWFD